MVRNRTFVSGRFFLMWRAASKEDSPVMPISINTMSGRRSRAFSTASPALEDSPTTSKSDSLSSSRRTPWRNSVWSSTSKHLIFGILIFLSSKGSAAKIRLLHPREKLAQHGAHFSLTLSSKGSAAKIRLLHPREKLAQHGAHFSLTLSARVNPRQSQTAPQLQRPVQARAR